MTVIDLRAMRMKPREDVRSLTRRIILERKIHLDALAQLTGTSVQGFIVAFRRAFHTTP